MPIGTLFLRFETVAPTTASGMMLEGAREDVQRRAIAHSAGTTATVDTVNDQMTQLGNQSDLYQAIGQLLVRLGALKGVIDVFSEVRP